MEIPGDGEWTFNSEQVSDEFDTHVREQLPWYDLATGIVSHIVNHYLPVNGVIYDVGAATGNITRVTQKTIVTRNATAISIEPSTEMNKNFKGVGKIVNERAEDFDFQNFDVAVLFLTMMFVPVNRRKKLLKNIIDKCNDGGCIVIFDKAPLFSGYLATVIRRLTISGKLAAGSKPDDIIAKELSLSGVQIPYIPEADTAERIFQFGEFCGWIIEK